MNFYDWQYHQAMFDGTEGMPPKGNKLQYQKEELVLQSQPVIYVPCKPYVILTFVNKE